MTSSTTRQPRRETARELRLLWVGTAATAQRLPPDTLEAVAASTEVVVEEGLAGAVERLRDGDVDCVVSDHRLPDLDGLALLETVRAYRHDLPFVLVPAEGGDEVASRAVEADVSGYVPPDAENAGDRLVETVRTQIGLDDGGDSPTPILGPHEREAVRLKERAMDQAPVGITIADTEAPGEPLIYVNDAFVDITGYSREASLGRNCRFLQGEATDPETVARMRAAIEAEEPVSVELRNYRRDGTQFWNRVDLYPIEDADGEVSYFAGFQTDITELKRLRSQLRAERQNLQDLLGRLEGLVSDLSDVLVRAETETEVFEMVADRLGEGSEYEFAWLGEYDQSTATVVPTEWPGGRDFDPDEVDLEAETATAELLDRAVTELSVEVTDSLADLDDPVAGPGDRCLVVPIYYREFTYGVALVYPGPDTDLTEHETRILSVIGRIVGAAIDAIRSKRVGLTDAGIEAAVTIENADLPFERMAERLDATFEFEGVIGRPDGGWSMLFTIRGADAEAVTERAEATEVVETVDPIVQQDGDLIARFVVEENNLLRVVTEHGVRLVDLSVDGDGLRVDFRAGGEEPARSVLRALDETYESTSLLEYRESDGFEETPRGFRRAVEADLTDRQLTALRNAYTAGFFDWPREVEGSTLADSMDVVPSTFHQHLRAAERKLLDAFFGA